MPYKTILLDLDGPLLDGRRRHYQCYADILTAHGYNPMPIDDYWAMKRERKSRREQLAVSGAESIYGEFLAEWLERIEDTRYLALDCVQVGAVGVLRKWASEDMEVILVTMRNNRENLMAQLELLGLLSYLSNVVVCKHALGGVGKAMALKRFIPDIDVSSCLWIGDTEADCEAARHLGCRVVLLTEGLRV
ncbi:MAG: HAD hydrolase-like protein, partial [Mariprofundaceae bacterium]|nr:HAD hydrolase-like protein [Mariprofundaceae bacterium]